MVQKGITILLAEDEQPLRDLLKAVFDAAGFSVLVAIECRTGIANRERAPHRSPGLECPDAGDERTGPGERASALACRPTHPSDIGVFAMHLDAG